MKRLNKTTSNIELTNDANLDVDTDDDLETKEIEDREENLFTLEKVIHTLKPLHFSLRCFGLAHNGIFQEESLKFNSVESEHNRSNADDVTQPQVNVRRQPKCSPGKCYCIFVSVILWYQVIFSSINLFAAKSFLDVMEAAIPVLTMTLCAGQQLLFFRAACTKNNKLSKFGKFLKELVLVKADDISGTERQIKVIVLLTWMSYISMIISVFTGLLYSDSTSRSGKNEIREFVVGKWNEKYLTIITYAYLPIHIILSGVWSFSIANYVALCLLVVKRFDDVFKRASTAISLKKNVNFAALRREHVQLCHVVSALDDILSPSGLLSYAIYIPVSCLSLNLCIITFDESSTTQKVTYIMWVVSIMAILFLISVAGALVSHKAYSLSDIIYDINAKELDRENKLEMMLLISNLNSNCTGLTVGGLTTMTKGMVLTVFGTVIGYFTILMQFKA